MWSCLAAFEVPKAHRTLENIPGVTNGFLEAKYSKTYKEHAFETTGSVFLFVSFCFFLPKNMILSKLIEYY